MLPRPPRSPLFPYTTLFRSRQHRGGERIAVAVAQGQEQRHLVLDMRFQPDLLLEKDLGNGAKALRRLIMLLAEILLDGVAQDRKSTRLNSSHQIISYAVFCL